MLYNFELGISYNIIHFLSFSIAVAFCFSVLRFTHCYVFINYYIGTYLCSGVAKGTLSRENEN